LGIGLGPSGIQNGPKPELKMPVVSSRDDLELVDPGSFGEMPEDSLGCPVSSEASAEERVDRSPGHLSVSSSS